MPNQFVIYQYWEIYKIPLLGKFIVKVLRHFCSLMGLTIRNYWQFHGHLGTVSDL